VNALVDCAKVKKYVVKRDLEYLVVHRHYGLPVVVFEAVVVVAIVVELVVFEGVGVVFEVPMPERLVVVILGIAATPVVVSTERVILPNPAEVFPDVSRLPFLKISTRRACRVDPSSFSKVACTLPVAFSTR
jgi:hypothetical protein